MSATREASQMQNTRKPFIFYDIVIMDILKQLKRSSLKKLCKEIIFYGLIK